MMDVGRRLRSVTDRETWAARGASFVAKAKATKAVWFPPGPVASTTKAAASSAKKATRKPARAGEKATRKTTGTGKKAAKKTTGAAKRATKKTTGATKKTGR